jgi:DNA-binding transcriptional ArsR family regulator
MKVFAKRGTEKKRVFISQKISFSSFLRFSLSQNKFGNMGYLFRYLSKYIIRVNTLFKALNDSTRRDILEMLKDGDLTAGEIADKFNISKPSISHHLDLLKQAELVTAVKEGQFIYYSLNTTVMDEMLKWFVQFTKTKKK